MARSPLSYRRTHSVNRNRRRSRIVRETVNLRIATRRLNLNPVNPPPVPAPQPEPVHSVPVNDLGLPYNSQNSVEHLHDPEPEYHPGPEYSDDSNSVTPLNVIPAQGAPADSCHSSVGDNFDYIDVADLLDETADFEYETVELADLEEERADKVAGSENVDVENLRYVLDGNRDLTDFLYEDFVQAGWDVTTIQDQYLRFLTRVRELYDMYMSFNNYPPEDWIRSTLHHFPRTNFWIHKTNELLDAGPIEKFHTYLLQIRSWVHCSM